jgi:hypothetical protein
VSNAPPPKYLKVAITPNQNKEPQYFDVGKNFYVLVKFEPINVYLTCYPNFDYVIFMPCHKYGCDL